jgi:hemerythrin-like domain-containing protein
MSAPDLRVCYAVHASLRTAAHRLAATAESFETASRRQKKAYRAYWKGYAGELAAHHKVEDDYFFLALADRVPASRDYMAQLSTDHHELDDLTAEATLAIDRVVEGRDGAAVIAAEVVREFATRMDAHLDFEDINVLPLFQYFTAEEYARLDDIAIRSLGVQAAFSVPFIASAVPAEERDRILGDAPLPFRAVYRMTRRRHNRMTVTAFGHDPATPASAPLIAVVR